MTLTYNDFDRAIKSLAKKIRYQNLYSYSKEGLTKFYEDNDLTCLQRTFLNKVMFYYSIYVDVSAGDVGEEVLKNDIRMEAYNVYKYNSYKNEKTKVDKQNLAHKFNKPNKRPQITSSKQWKIGPNNRR